MTTHPGSKAARLLDIVARNPGISRAEIQAATDIDRDTVTSTLGRFKRAGHVSTDTRPGDSGMARYWLERATEPTASDRVLSRLQRGPATWGDLVAILGRTGLATILTSLESSGMVRVEQRTRIGYTGRTVCAPNLYHAVVDCQQAAK